MKTLFKNGSVINVFTDKMEKANVLVENGVIVGVGDYHDTDADWVEDVSGKYLCPGFIDGHIHIESSMLTPAEFARASLCHGTTSVVADPHEIANVAGVAGIEYMLEASEGMPQDIYIALPSCVPATPLDEAGAILTAEELRPLYTHERVVALGEMMNYPGVLAGDEDVFRKIRDAQAFGKTVNGHAPAVSGCGLDRYLSAGIEDDHECATAEEALERVAKGQWVMIRQGTAAKNLEALLPLFKEPYCRRCLLVSDDKHPADLLREGHIDAVIRKAATLGASPIVAIRMATLQAAEHFRLRGVGAVAPGYRADLLVLGDPFAATVERVYKSGRLVAEAGKVLPFASPAVREKTESRVRKSFSLDPLKEEDFFVAPDRGRCRIIRVIPHQLFTAEESAELDFGENNGISVKEDILKLAVIERHSGTGHRGIGYIRGIGIQRGAIASSVSHDSHNLIVIGASEKDMTVAANRVRELGGGNVVAVDGKVLAEMPLPVAGLMSDLAAEEVAGQNECVRSAVKALGAHGDIEPFMNMAFISLPVIPSLKMTTHGLVRVETQELLPLFMKTEE